MLSGAAYGKFDGLTSAKVLRVNSSGISLPWLRQQVADSYPVILIEPALPSSTQGSQGVMGRRKARKRDYFPLHHPLLPTCALCELDESGRVGC